MTTQQPSPQLQTADIEWSDGLPLSKRFGDLYYSRDDGLQESRHVFIDGNDLPMRWQLLADGENFTIFETGFGTGLNFLAAAALWLDSAPPQSRLNFVSVEKYPLSREQMATALLTWPQLSTQATALLHQYPPPVQGIHQLWLFDNRVKLTLIFDDAIAGFNSLLASTHPAFSHIGNPVADAWFLDGFAPSKNPDLWTDALFQLMAQFSHKKFCRKKFCHKKISNQNTTYATFTVARQVRDGLANAGFTLEKRPGFGRKRDMLRGHFNGLAATEGNDAPDWVEPKVLRNSSHEASWHLNIEAVEQRTEAIVIGAGIAGCTTAAALKRRGWRVSLIDRHPQPGQEASGNPQGILYPKLSTEDSALALFGRHALCHGLHFYEDYWQSGNPGERCGVLVLPENNREKLRFEDIGQRFANAPGLVRTVAGSQLNELAGVPLDADSGLFFPALGWVQPPAVCAWLSTGIPFLQATVTRLERDEDNALWQLFDSSDQLLASAPVVIVANSYSAAHLDQCAHLPLRKIRGQISALPASRASSALRTVICGAGYMAPTLSGVHTLGATYDVDETDTHIRGGDHDRNLQLLAKTDEALPRLWSAAELKAANLDGRAGIRCTTPDYLPIAGPAPDIAGFTTRFAAYGRNGKADIPLPGCYLPGLWLNCGHGSRGLTYAPMVAELLAAQINGDISPLPRHLTVALNPARFIIRNLKRHSGQGANTQQ
ncbi:MAG: bifunctional tRNA (5-methylaminomethyl-2-thiouridine)(34)-methyltransferase MnmD/FAD-dependent 5-carboxymethylaminomethyl-2-thiouridine(34) oxidoreductase MnmC [Porticoccaceae bacterium]